MDKVCVLIIEDNRDIRESTAEILCLANFNVLQAENGKRGVEMALQYLPDIILCDIMMPELDGYGVLRLLSNRDETSTIPFVFLTAKTERMDMRKAMEMGADDYLTKPFDDIELLNVVQCRLKKYAEHKRIISDSLNRIDNLFSHSPGLVVLRAGFNEKKIRSVKKKQIIYYEGDTPNSIYLVVSGLIKTVKTARDGRELSTELYGQDEYFGITALLTDQPYQDTAEAVTDSAICALPKPIVNELLYKYPDIAKKFIKILANNVIHKEEQLLQLAYHSVRKRMADLLLRLCNRESITSSTVLNISRENLASMAGMAVETVSRILSDFKEEGLIERTMGSIQMLSIERLQNLKN